ncbi:MAG: hypothetical protein ACI4RD_10905 [Kiritimatiellia bacterium]
MRVDEDRALTADEMSTLNGGSETELVKEGAGVLTTDGLTGFKGTITVRSGGAIRITSADGLGKSGTVVNIESGSSLLVYNGTQNAISLAGVEVRIAGSGHDGAGAVQLSGENQNYLFYKLTLTDDAKMGGAKNWGSINTGSGSIIDFGGHTLTNATGCMWRFGQMLNPGDVIQTAGSVQATGGCGFIGGDAHEFVLDGGTLSLYDWRIPCTWTLHVKRTTNVHPGSGTDKELSNVWSGPTILDEGVAFGVGSSAAQTKGFQMTLGGKVSGAGQLVVYNLATINLLSENTFTGGVAMGNSGSICAAVDGSLPVIDGSVTLPALTASCRVYLRAKSASNPDGWTSEHLNQYLTSGICQYCIVDTPEDERIDLGTPASCYNALLSTGAGFSITGSDDAASPVVMATSCVRRGLLTLDDGFFSFHDESGQGGTVSVSSDYGITPIARLVFGENYRGVLQGATTPRVINVGCTPGTVGIVDVRDGAVLTNGFGCGFVTYNDAAKMTDGQIAAGAVYQRGGEVAAVEKTSVNLADNGGYGYYELQQGCLYANYPMAVGGRNGIGIFRQNGGEWKMGANSVNLGAGGTGVVYQAAGTFTTITQDISLGNTSGTGCDDTFHPFANWTIAGTAQTETRNFYGGAHSNFKSYLNLIDGGTLYANNIHKRETGYLPSTAAVTELVNNDFYVNFNGGVFRRRLQDNLFNADHLPTRVTVYPKGAIFRVDGNKDTLAYVSAPLLAPGAGNGVTAVACPETTDYVGAPFVEIVGDGQGATAVALFDVEQNSVTNVVVTSPGWGYTEATAVFTGGGCKGSVVTACTLGDVSGGGLVKRGVGILELRSVCTYAGPTTVEAGILRQTVEGAIPAGTKLVLQQGATLDLNNLAATFSGVGGTGGAVKNGDLVLTGVLELSARKFIDRETTAIDGVLDLTGVAQLKMTDTAVLTEEASTLRSSYLLKATSIRYPAQPFEIVGVPNQWKIACTSTGIRLAPNRGLGLLVR